MTWWYIASYVTTQDHNEVRVKLHLILCKHLERVWVKEVCVGGSIFRTLIPLTLGDSGKDSGPELKPFMNCFSLVQLSTVSPCWDLTSLRAGKMCSILCLSLASLHSKWTAIQGSYSTIQATAL